MKCFSQTDNQDTGPPLHDKQPESPIKLPQEQPPEVLEPVKTEATPVPEAELSDPWPLDPGILSNSSPDYKVPGENVDKPASKNVRIQVLSYHFQCWLIIFVCAFLYRLRELGHFSNHIL